MKKRNFNLWASIAVNLRTWVIWHKIWILLEPLTYIHNYTVPIPRIIGEGAVAWPGSFSDPYHNTSGKLRKLFNFSPTDWTYLTQINHIKYSRDRNSRSIYHTQVCACTEQSINMITDDLNCVCFHGYSSCVRSISSDEIFPWNECSSYPVYWVVVALGLQGEERERTSLSWKICQ